MIKIVMVFRGREFGFAYKISEKLKKNSYSSSSNSCQGIAYNPSANLIFLTI